MNFLHIWLTFGILMTLIFWKMAMPRSDESAITIGKFTVPLLFLFAFTLRIVLSAQYKGFNVDINCFAAWSERMVKIGPSGFYSSDYFSDYPPLYLYILYILGMIQDKLSLVTFSASHLVLLKLPAICADVAIGYLLYRTCNRLVGLRSSLCLTCIYLFQPVVLLNSCLWGQIDSFFTLFLLLVCLFLERQNLLPAMLFFGLGVLLKPQMLIFTPALILGVIHYVFRGGFSLRSLMKALSYTLLTVILMILLASPFGMENVIPQYVSTLASYPYASVNAYNFWAGVGLNWYPQTTAFMGMPASTWGFIAIVLAASLSIVLGIRLGNLHQKYTLVSAFLIITVFTFSVRMHERYLYPILALLPLAYAGLCSRQLSHIPLSKRDLGLSQMLSPELRYLFPLVFTLYSGLHFFNCGNVLFFYDPATYDRDALFLKITGIGMTLTTLLFYLLVLRLQSKKDLLPADNAGYKTSTVHAPIRILSKDMRLTRLDFLLLLFITVFYSVFALRDLGSLRAPETELSIGRAETVRLEFPAGRKVSSFAYYMAPEHDRPLLIGTCASDGSAWESTTCKLNSVFTWQNVELLSESQYVTLTPQSTNTVLFELVFFDQNGNPVLPLNASDYPALFDEAALYPKENSFRYSMYFDEIYHGRTAYEFLHGLRSYENTHPPLGKILISLGILLFGMNPFGWRIVGTLFGIAMLPMLYLFAKRLTGDTPCAALSCFLFAFDFMHFAQTRLATIDVFIVFFIICMYYFLYYFMTLDYGATSASKLCLPLGLCGISMGLGVSCKWTGVYAGMGMAVLFFGHLYLMYQKQKKQAVRKTGKDDSFRKKTQHILLFCIVFFVIFPLVIYVASYLPFRDNTDHSLIERAWDNQKTMYQYHSTLEATHYFSSPFYEWPFLIKPIWYYSGVLEGGLREGISSFGNPLVWWAGLPAFAYMIYLILRRKDRRALFLVIGYLAQYLPWFFVERLTFIYHYFPSVIFVVLMIGYSFRNWKEHMPRKAFLALAFLYALLVFGLFLLFYPVLAGQPVEVTFVTKYLRWFKEWFFVAN